MRLSAGLPFAPWANAAAARELRTVMYSRPGYGTSTSMPGRKIFDAAADVARVVDALGARTFRTIGWSGGGPHALACASALNVLSDVSSLSVKAFGAW